MMQKTTTSTRVPTRFVGPMHFYAMNDPYQSVSNVSIDAPIATYETTLFHSIGRGAKITRLAQTMQTTVLSDQMTRSLLLEATDAFHAVKTAKRIQESKARYQQEIVRPASRHATLIDIQIKIVANLLYVRLAFETGEASGHNMATFASDLVADQIIQDDPSLKYVSVSGNYCVDKKVSAVNSILGRGKSVVAEIWLTRKLLHEELRTTPERIIELNIKKNLIGSIAAGSLMSANAHYANMLLAFYIATGQDGANVVEGSQGITHAELQDDRLYFAVTLPNIIVGTIGHGKDTEDAKNNLSSLGCLAEGGSLRLAQIAAALVLCGELSLLAALTNEHELSLSHKTIERANRP
jgi:hydroxymethylglutaryl-CoA reductase (NADPH)